MGRNVESSNSLENIYKARKIWYLFYFSFLPGYQETQRYVFCLNEEVFFNPSWYCQSVLGSFENLQFPLTCFFDSRGTSQVTIWFHFSFSTCASQLLPSLVLLFEPWKDSRLLEAILSLLNLLKVFLLAFSWGLGDNLERKYFSSDTWHPSFPFHPRN